MSNAALKELLTDRWAQPESHWSVRQAPFGVTIDGVRMWAVSDGHTLIALEGEDAPELSEKYELVRTLLSYPSEVAMSLAELRAFCGPAEWGGDVVEEKCWSCSGRKVAECECDCGHVHDATCEECEGTGTTTDEKWPEVRHGKIEGRWFDLNLIAQSLDGLTGEVVNVGLTPLADYSGYFTARGDGWRIVLIGVRVADEAMDAPSLVLHTVAA